MKADNLKHLSEEELTVWKMKRPITFFVFMFQTFLSGVNYSVIMPTLWFYLLQLKAPNPKTFYGLIIGGQTLIASLFSLILSRLADRTRRIKLILLSVHVPVILGNICYTVGVSPYLLVLGRWLAGLSSSLVPVIFGEITRSYEPELQTRVIAMVSFSNGLGTILGPASGMIFRNTTHFDVGELQITSVNAGPFFLTFAYVLIEGAILLCVSDLSREYDLKEVLRLQSEAEENTENCSDIESKKKEEQSLTRKGGETDSNTKINILKICFRNQAMLVLFFTAFMAGFSNMSSEVISILTASKTLQWSTSRISLVLTFPWIIHLTACFIIWGIGKNVSTARLLLHGFPVNIMAAVTMIGLGFHQQTNWITVFFVICLLVCYSTSWALEKIPIRVLAAKLISSANQSFVESFRYSIIHFGSSLGALLGSINSQHLDIFGITLLLVLLIDYVLIWRVREILLDPKPIDRH